MHRAALEAMKVILAIRDIQGGVNAEKFPEWPQLSHPDRVRSRLHGAAALESGILLFVRKWIR
jgi:hypothetical protein